MNTIDDEPTCLVHQVLSQSKRGTLVMVFELTGIFHMALAQLPEELLLRVLTAACQGCGWGPTLDLYVLPRVCKQFNKVSYCQP